MRKTLATLLLILSLPTLALAKTVTVEQVLDGNTFMTTDGDRVRLIGVDVPNSQDCYATKSKNYLDHLIGGKEVTLKFDDDKHDSKNRLLAYVYSDSFINRKLLQKGYGTAVTDEPNTAHTGTFTEDQVTAQKEARGVWGHCDDIIADYLPAKVTNVSVSDISTDSAEINWDEVDLARSYQMFYRTSSDTDWTIIKGITDTTYTLTGLSDSTDYDVKVVGKNYLGKGSKSSVVEFTTEQEEQVPVTALSLDISVSDATPEQNSDVDVQVTVTDQLGRPVEGATGSATAHYKSTDTTKTFSTSDSNGGMTATFTIGRATLGYEVVVDVSISYGGLTASGETSFVPE